MLFRFKHISLRTCPEQRHFAAILDNYGLLEPGDSFLSNWILNSSSRPDGIFNPLGITNTIETRARIVTDTAYPATNAFRIDDLEKSNLNPWYEGFINIQCRYFTSADVDPETRPEPVFMFTGWAGVAGAQLRSAPRAPDCGKSIRLRAPQTFAGMLRWATSLRLITIQYAPVDPFTCALNLNPPLEQLLYYSPQLFHNSKLNFLNNELSYENKLNALWKPLMIPLSIISEGAFTKSLCIRTLVIPNKVPKY